MLIGIASCLGPQLLYNLRSMGHGDEIAIVDGNYPGHSDAGGKGGLVRADGVGVLELLDAILKIMPIDSAVEHAVMIATVGGDGKTLDPIHQAIRNAVGRRCGKTSVLAMKGPDFYERVKLAHTLVASSETSLYANVILRKGALHPE